MGYNDRDEPAAEPDARIGIAQLALSAAVRLVGVAVLCVGVWAGVKVIVEAWALYEQPQRIERFAAAIQAGSNLDGLIGNLVVASAQEGETGEAGAAAAPARRGEPGGTLRLSYFAAWFIALLLIFVIGALAMTAVTTGGQLALYDLQVRRHSRAVIKEVRRMQRA